MTTQRAWVVLEPPKGMGGLSYDDGWAIIKVRPQFVQQWVYNDAEQPPNGNEES